MNTPSSLRGVAAACVALGCALASAAVSAAPDDAAVAAALLARSNALRAASGLAALEVEPRLSAAALNFAAYMAQTDRYGHEADGHSPAERARAQGYAYCAIAENIAYAASPGNDDDEAGVLAQRLFDGWVSSAPHRRNLLDAELTDVGVASAFSARSARQYAVLLVGRPSAAAVVVSLANRTRTTVRYEFAGELFALEPGVTRTHSRCRKSTLALKDAAADPRAARPLTASPGARYQIEDGLEGCGCGAIRRHSRRRAATPSERLGRWRRCARSSRRRCLRVPVRRRGCQAVHAACGPKIVTTGRVSGSRYTTGRSLPTSGTSTWL